MNRFWKVFFYEVEDGAKLPTTAGYAALAVLILLLLAMLFFLGRKQAGKHLKTKELAFSAVAMGLAFVTSFIQFGSLPFGGSITLFSMFFICFIGYLYGPRVGLVTGFAYGLLQLIVDPMIYYPIQVLLDYPLAFGMLGLSGVFCKKKYGLMWGYLLGVFGRYVCHVISGYVFFREWATGNPILYTLSYNATYLVPEAIATILIVCIPVCRKAFAEVKRMAN